jgi:hypothetical protein
MNILASEIVAQAGWWKSRNCRETSRNRGGCIDEIHQRFDGTVNRDPYCAKFVWVVVDMACTYLGLKNLLPRTAGARRLLDLSRTVLDVDRMPTAGSIFYRKSTAKGATGHMGVVIQVVPEGIYTVEGNNGSLVTVFHYTTAEIQNRSNAFEFIHTDRMYPDLAETEGSNLVLVGCVLAGLAAVTWYISESR